MGTYYPAGPARARLRAHADDSGQSLPDLADALGLPLRTLNRVLGATRIRWNTADRVAVALGSHPSELWPDWFDTATPFPGRKDTP